MKHPTQIRYVKSLSYCPKLAGPVLTNIAECWPHRISPYLRLGREPQELTFLAGSVASVLENLSGQDLRLAHVRSLLGGWTAFRDRFFKVARDQGYDEKGALPEELSHDPVAIVHGYIGFGFCREDFDSHIKALRHLWFGPVNNVHIGGDWSFDIAVDDRRRFLASQYALAALLYVDAAQLASRRGKGPTRSIILCGARMPCDVRSSFVLLVQINYERNFVPR